MKLKVKLFFAFCVMLLTNMAIANDLLEGGIHTPTICSAAAINDCAHLRFDENPTSTKESVFLVHLMPADQNTNFTDINVLLWMDMGNGHGHGSAPVEISATEENNHFVVSNAWFVMMGQWQVIVTFKDKGIDQKIIIPVNVNQ